MSNSTTKHTPPPWRIGSAIGPNHYIEDLATIQHAAFIGTDADAAFVIQAVNSHQDLYERLCMVIEGYHVLHMRETGQTDPLALPITECEYLTCKFALKTLANARGES